MALNPNLRSFTFNLTDLQFIAAQIAFQPLFYKSSTSNTGFSPVINWDGVGAVYDSTGLLLSNGGLVATDAAALAAVNMWGTSYNSYTDISGLRDVTGNYNNLIPGQSTWGASNQVFSRITAADFTHYVQQAIGGLAETNDSISSNSTDTAAVSNSISITVPAFGGHPSFTYAVTYNSFDRTVTVTDISTVNNHHTTVNTNAVTTTTTLQSYTQDTTGEHTLGAATTTTATSSFLTGGELDPLYHTGLAAKITAAQVGTLAMNDYNPGKAVVDYTPRMISETITTGGHVTYGANGKYIKGDGVVLLHDASNHIVYWDGTSAMAGLLASYSYDGTKAIDTLSLVLGSAIVDTTVPLMPGQPDGLGANGAAGHTGTGDGNVYAGNGYGELALVGQHDKQNTDANNVTGHGNHEYFYGNIASIGGNAPNNGFMALFGQFFDHGLDFIGKSGTNAAGHTVTITIPLAVNDPLYGQIGQDGQPTTSITINRATVDNHWVRDAAGNLLDGHDLAHSVLASAGVAAVDALGAAVSTAGADGIWGTADDIKSIGANDLISGATLGATSPTYINHTSPYIDQSQTYGSVSDVTQVLREWVVDPNTGKYVAGAKLFDGTHTVAYTDAFGNTTQNTLPTLNELRAAVTGSQRTALTWEDVTQDLRHRDGSGHVAYYSSSINPVTQLADEVAYLDVNGVAHWSDPLNLTPVVLTGLHTVAGGEPLLLDMNPHLDVAHLAASPGSAAAMAALTANAASLGLTFGVELGVVTLHVPAGFSSPTSPAQTFTGLNALAPWVNFADFSIQSNVFNVPAPGFGINDALHAAVGEILMDSVGDHYIAGDGRANENFGLTAIHHAFHEEHGFQVVNIENAIRNQDTIATNLDLTNNHGTGDGTPSDPNHAILHGWQVQVGQKVGDVLSGGATLVGTHYENLVGDYTDKAGNISWDQEKLFTGAKMTVEMEYQHSVVDQYARAVTPNIQEFAGVTTAKNAAISLEYGQAAFRFGHSTLRDTIDTMDPTQGITGKIMSFALERAFLNPGQYAQVGAGAVILGETRQLMNETDQFVTPSLNEGLLGQPLDLAAINIARGRDVGLPTLNAFKSASGVGTIYNSWNDFHDNMIHPERVVDFIAAYSFDGDLDKAQTIVDLNGGVALSATEQTIASANGWDFSFAHRFMTGDKTADTADGVNHIDLWIGGLAEVHVAGGILGETFDAIFVNQIENLMDGDRLYYLQRLVNQGFGNEMQNEQLKDIFERTTGIRNINGNIFTYADAYYDEGKNARLATEDLKDPTKLTDLYDANKVKVMTVDGTGHSYTTAVSPTHVPLFDVWGNAVRDLYSDAAHTIKVFDSQTLHWTATGTTSQPTAVYNGNPVPAYSIAPLFFDDTSYVGAADHKYGSLVAANETHLLGALTVAGTHSMTSATDVTDPNHAVAVSDNGLGSMVGDTGLGIWSGDDPTTLANGTITDHTILVKYGDEATAGSSQSIQFHETFINDSRPTGSTVNLDGSIDTGTNSAEILVGTAHDDYIRMGIGDDTAYGGDGNDFLFGGMANAGANKLYGGAGNDYLVGGDAPDLIDGGSGDDWIFEQSSGSSVNGVGQSIGGSGNDHIFGGIGIDKIFGGTGDDYIYGGNDTDPTVFGGDGNDYMNGNSGVDVMNGDNGDDIMDGGPGVDQLFGGNGDDILRPGDIADVAGNGGGGDVLIGGDAAANNAGVSTDTGFDFADYSQTTTSVGLVGDLANQAAVGTLPADKTPLPPGVPRATNIGDVWFEMEGIIGTKNNDHLMGDSAVDPGALVSKGSNWLIGGSGNDLIEGRGGNDVIIGGSIRLDSLNGTYLSASHTGDAYRAANDYTENAEGATHRIYDDAVLQHNGLLDAASVNGYGITYAKHLTTLEMSRAYKDYVLGDNASLANASASPVTDAKGGTDTVVYGGNRSDYTIAAGSAATAHQGTLAYEMIHDNRAVTATGILVSDSTGLISGDGTDLVAGVTEFQFADQSIAVGNLNATLDIVQVTPGVTAPFGTFNAILSNAADQGTGVNATTIAWQRVGGGGGLPTGVTALGATLTIDGTFAVPTSVQRYDAVATVHDAQGFTSTFTSGELIIGTNGNNNNLNGTAGNDIIYGLGGNDRLNGGAGADLMYGGAGNDTYVVDNVGDVVVEAVGGGTDTVQTTLSSYTLGANVENLTFTGTGNFKGTGNGLANVITGGAGNDTLDGGAGSDTAAFTGNAWASSAALRGGVFSMTTALGGTDTLAGFETVRFGATANYNLATSTSNVANTVGGSGASDYIEAAGTGVHTINAGANDDVIVWSATGAGTVASPAVLDGRDIVDGGSNSTGGGARGDTFVINGNAEAETFDVYSRAAWIAAAGSAANQTIRAGQLNGGSQIIITRNGTDNAHVIGELRNVEEIQINTGGAIAGGIDHVHTHGSFGGTGLNTSTITVMDQGVGQADVDVTDMTSPEHIALYSTGAADIIIGERPQDEIIVNGVSTTGGGVVTTVDTSGTNYTAADSTQTAITGSDDRHNGTYAGDTIDLPTAPPTGGTDTTTAPVVPAAPVDHAATLNGDDTSNLLTAGNLDNTVAGHGGDDLISVGNGNNLLSGGAGDDTIVAGNGNNHVDGGAGNDDIYLGSGTNWVSAGAGDDTVFTTGTGNTTFVDSGTDGNDTYHGGGASDTLDMSAISANIQANLGTGYAGWAKVGTEVNHLYGIENIATGTGDDTITASAAHNTIDVGDHSATGHDTVIFRSAGDAAGDTIQNFQAGDKIDMTGFGMGSGAIHLVAGTSYAANQIAYSFEQVDGAETTVLHGQDGSSHQFELDIKGHHLLTGTDFAA